VLRRYADFNTQHHFLFLIFIKKKYTRHRTRSASVYDRKKSCGSGSADWRVRSPHISECHLWVS